MAMNLVLAIGIMIIAGFFAGRLAHKLKFPMISGYIVVGILLSSSVLNIISRTSIKDLDIFTSIALGIIALLPAAGVTIGLGLLAQSAFPTFGDLIYNGILASVIINEIIAPPLVKYAVFKSGEQGRLASEHIQAKR